VIDGVGGGICVSQEFVLTSFPEIDRKGLYALRDKSGVSPQEFYLQLVDEVTYEEKVDVRDV
jgi:hypothetical protein